MNQEDIEKNWEESFRRKLAEITDHKAIEDEAEWRFWESLEDTEQDFLIRIASKIGARRPRF